MTAPRRNTAQRARDLEFVSELYLHGRTQHQIAEAVNAARPYNITQQTISNDLARLRERWQERAARNIGEVVAEELRKIDALERTYLEAWQRSVQQQIGDPRFLQGVQWCINKRCELLGANAPERINIGFDGVQSLIINGIEIKF